MKNELTKWRFIFVVSYLNMLEKKEIPVVEVSGERKKERERQKNTSHTVFMALNLDPRTQNETKRTKRCRSQRPRSVRQKKKNMWKKKNKTSIVDVEKEKIERRWAWRDVGGKPIQTLNAEALTLIQGEKSDNKTHGRQGKTEPLRAVMIAEHKKKRGIDR